MIPNTKKLKSGQLNTVDRISKLPDFTIHHILSFLDTREAYRTSILSKRWAYISATNPIIEFHYYSMEENSRARYWPSDTEVSARLLEYMDTRMQRFDQESLRVRTLRLELPNSNRVFGCDVEQSELSCKVDEWIRIAVRNQVKILEIDGPINYQLPDILLSAKSLSRLDCTDVEIPYYNKAVNLESLQTVVLSNVVAEERMLNHIISSSPLLNCLSVEDCSGYDTIVIPSCSQLKDLTLIETNSPENRTFILENSSITSFQYTEFGFFDRWRVMSKPGSLRNLRVLAISSPGMTDQDLYKLLPELVSLQILQLSDCFTLRTFRISSNRLKQIYLIDCSALIDVNIDAPSLMKFEYAGEFSPHRAITISSQACCDIFVDTTPVCLDTQGFLKLKRLMTGLSRCNALEISLIGYSDQSVDDIKFNEEELGDVNLGHPRHIRELKLTLDRWKLSTSSVSAFLNGLFWTCHPDNISLRVHYKDPGLMIQHLMSELEKMAKCRSDPLKRVKSANRSNLLKSKDVAAQFRLHW